MWQTRRKKASHTIDGNGNSLREVEAIGTLEGGDLARGVDLVVLSAGVELSSRVSLGGNQLQLQVVVLSSDQDGEGATVVLEKVRKRRQSKHVEMKKTYRLTVKLSEGHFECEVWNVKKKERKKEEERGEQEFCAGGTTSVPGGTDDAGDHMTWQKTRQLGDYERRPSRPSDPTIQPIVPQSWRGTNPKASHRRCNPSA